jgi:hypothetical protein
MSDFLFWFLALDSINDTPFFSKQHVLPPLIFKGSSAASETDVLVTVSTFTLNVATNVVVRVWIRAIETISFLISSAHTSS